MKDKNPYQAKNGGPLHGKEKEFFDWARDQRLKEIDKLPEPEQKKAKESERKLAHRMMS